MRDTYRIRDDFVKKIRHQTTHPRVCGLVAKEFIKKGEPLSEKSKNFLQKRLDNLIDLQDSLGADCMGTREKLLFLMYNTMLPLYGEEDATSLLKEMNLSFKYPLGGGEIRHLIFEGKKKEHTNTATKE